MAASSQQGSVLEVALVFLRLGCISFGGPVAHLGYFQEELVRRRQWCDEVRFAEMIALAQSLPGPSSSQVCFGLGVVRAGWRGGLAAWVAFTLPSTLLMLAFAFGSTLLSGRHGLRLIHGLQLVAVAVVAQAVLTMQRSLAPDRRRLGIAIAAVAIVLFVSSTYSTILSIVAGALAGLLLLHPPTAAPPSHTRARGLPRATILCGTLLIVCLLALPIAARLSGRLELQALSAFFRAGALVFGGGHVVLPLLHDAVVTRGWVPEPTFLAGYGAAQAVPGPLFTFGAFLGASLQGGSHRILLGLIGLLGLNAPGLLAMAAVLPYWSRLSSLPQSAKVFQGINAAVVGVLIATLYTHLWSASIQSPLDFFIALVAFALLTAAKVQPWIVVLCATLYCL